MNHIRHYNLLVERARNRSLNSYSEKHRIVPGCLGGTYTKDNVVCLTPREHYVAHQLLIKIYPNEPKLVYAAHAMTVDSNGERANSRLYSWIRRKLANAASQRLKGIPNLSTAKALRGKPKPEKQKGLVIDNVSYKSRKEAATILGVSEATIYEWLRSPNKTRSTWNKGITINSLKKSILVDGIEYPSRKEAALRLGVDTTTIYNWIKSGRAKSV